MESEDTIGGTNHEMPFSSILRTVGANILLPYARRNIIHYGCGRAERLGGVDKGFEPKYAGLYGAERPILSRSHVRWRRGRHRCMAGYETRESRCVCPTCQFEGRNALDGKRNSDLRLAEPPKLAHYHYRPNRWRNNYLQGFAARQPRRLRPANRCGWQPALG